MSQNFINLPYLMCLEKPAYEIVIHSVGGEQTCAMIVK